MLCYADITLYVLTQMMDLSHDVLEVEVFVDPKDIRIYLVVLCYRKDHVRTFSEGI